MVEEDPRRRVKPVALAVIDRDPVPVDLGHPVGAARVEGRALGLRDFLNLSEHLGRRRLVEADLWVDDPDRVEDAGHTECSGLTGEYGLSPRGRNERLCGEVVDLDR